MDKIVLQDVVSASPKLPIREEPKQSFLSRERREERRFDTQQSLEYKISKHGGMNKWLVIVGIVVIVAGILMFVNLNDKAVVTITPKSIIAKVDSNLIAYKEPADGSHLLAFRIIELSGEESTNVPASGSKYAERKAGGKISVTNSGGENVRIIANSRFKSSEGKIFRSTSAFSVGPSKTVVCNVVADEPGADYNIGPSTFTIPGLVGGPLSSVLTSKSGEAMSGGYKGDMKIVSDTDLARAKTSLEGSLTQKLLDQVSGALDENSVFFGDAYSTSFALSENEAGAEDPVDTQGVLLEGRIYAVVFDKRSLAGVIAKRELADFGEDTVDFSNWSDLSVTLNSYDNLKGKKEISLRISGDAKFVWVVDTDKIAHDLVGISKDSYKTVFLNHTAVYQAEVEIKPFWRTTFPSEVDKISLNIVPS